MLWWLLLLLACARAVVTPIATPTSSGVQVQGQDLVRVEVLSVQGVPLASQSASSPVQTLALSLPWPSSGPYQVRVRDAAGVHTLPLYVDLRPVQVWVEAPTGQLREPLHDGDQLILRVPEGPSQSALILSPRASGLVQVLIGERSHERVLRAGEPWSLPLPLAELPLGEPLSVQVGSLHATLLPQPLSSKVLAEQLRVTSVVFPAEVGGQSDPARPKDRVQLPALWWSTTLDRLALGTRARDEWAPWAWQAVTLDNSGPEPINVVLRLQILDETGAPAQAFRPKLRDTDDGTGTVSVLLRVPATSSATATLPIFVSEDMLSMEQAGSSQWTQVLSLTPLGSSEPLSVLHSPLYVSRGSSLASLGFLLALASAAGGTALLLWKGGSWLRAPTSELMTIALFGSLSFTVGAAGRLLTTGISTLLGPFATFLTALVDECLRYSLLATLLTLLPKPGTATLYVLTSWLLSGLVLGGFTPTDLLFVGGRVLWLEGALYLSGVTRSRAWLDQSATARWLRLGVALAIASVATSATGLVLHVVLYRLFLAPWYVAGVLAGPGFLYVLLACGLAIPFADSLRRIQR